MKEKTEQIFTKEDKILIYEKVLSFLKDAKMKKEKEIFICNILKIILAFSFDFVYKIDKNMANETFPNRYRFIKYVWWVDNAETTFEEFFYLQPKDKTEFEPWWDINNYDSRIIVIQNILNTLKANK